MKATGIVRKVDDLGRLVLPKELRRTLKIHEGDPLEIFTENDGSIILKAYKPGCVCCGNLDNLKELPDGVKICQKCIDGMR
jgi:transcriptional pleiotropic regulator of transition state genes